MSNSGRIHQKMLAMNEALLLGSLRQHELTEEAERLNAQLRMEVAGHKLAETALRKSEARYHGLFNAIDEGFCVIERIGNPASKAGRKPSVKRSDFRYIETNAAFGVQSGLRGVTGKTIRQLLPDEADEWCRIYDSILRTGRPVRFERVLAINARMLELYAFKLKDENPHRVAVIFRDVTERNKIEDAKRRIAVLAASNLKLEQEILRREAVEKSLLKSERHEKHLRERARHLAHQVLHSQEEERLRISRELHDQVVQALMSIKVRLVTLRNKIRARDPEIGAQLSMVQHLVGESVNTVHQFSRDLRPSLLDDLGLIPTLKNLSKAFLKDTGIRPRLTIYSGVEKLDGTLLIVLYRVIQEALANVARHAKADAVEIEIREAGGEVSMTVRDNGEGFKVDTEHKTKRSTRLGLVGMEERLEMVGGTFDIQSVMGESTTITATAPIKLRQRG